MKKYEFVLLDFDGTISKSAPGVKRCIELTLKEMEKPCPVLSDYSKYIGPPLTRTFQTLCGLTKEESLKALPIYRKYYHDVGLFENRFFEGVEAVLKALKASALKTAVCTSKNEVLAEKSMAMIGASGYIDAICGSKDDGSRKEKEELIPYALKTLGCRDKSKALMIGDTFFDAKGAESCGVDFLGVLYGYGDIEEMKKYPAVGYAKTADEILDYLL